MLVILDEAFRKNAFPEFQFSVPGWAWIWSITFMKSLEIPIEFAQPESSQRWGRPYRKLEPGDEPTMKGIFLVSSGMMVEHTPSYILASSLVGNERNSILFVGYCDPDTPGGKLLSSDRESHFEFKEINRTEIIKAKIAQFDLSGHADRDALLSFAKEFLPRPFSSTTETPKLEIGSSNPLLNVILK